MGEWLSVQFSRSVVSDSVTPWIAAHQDCLSITNSQSSPRFTSIESVMPSSHLILCRPLSSCPQSLPASESFPMSQLFSWGGQSTGVSALASFLPNFQFLIPLVLWILVLESRILSLRSWYWYKCPHWSEDTRRTPWDMFESVWCQILS